MPGRIHVRVVRAHVVIGVVLHGIEAGHPRANEAEVIGAADLVDDVRARADVAERFEPRIEDRSNAGVLLEIETVNGPGARIVIEVDG